MGHGGVSITLCNVQAVSCRPGCKMVWMCSPLDACLGDVRNLACVSGVKVGASSQCPPGARRASPQAGSVRPRPAPQALAFKL